MKKILYCSGGFILLLLIGMIISQLVYAQPIPPFAAHFILLIDTPSTYTGQAGKFAKVNDAENALVFGAMSGQDAELTDWIDDVELGEDGSLTLPTGEDFTIGTTQWNSGDEIDGTIIKDADYGDIAVSAGGAWTLDGDCVDESHIADNGIDSEHYNDGSIDLVHLAAGVYAKDLVTTAPITGAADNIFVGADSDVTVAITLLKDIVATSPMLIDGGANVDDILPGADADLTISVTVAKDIVTTAPLTGAVDNVIIGTDADITLGIDILKDLVTTAPVTGGTNDIFPGADADITVALDFTAAWDFGGAASVELPNAAAPTTDAAGEIALDTTIADHQPLWQYYDGGENMTLIAIDTAQLPAEDNEAIIYDAASDKFVLEAQAGAAGGDAWGDAVDADILPTGNDDTYDIGAADAQFKDGYFDGTLEADILTEGGVAVLNTGEYDAGTDPTADLEEEDHASEHAVSGGDTVFPADPDVDGILLWDDNPGVLEFGAIGAGLAYDGATLTATGATTAWDDIGDPDTDDTIALTGYKIRWSSTLDEPPETTAAVMIDHIDADVTNATTLFQIQSRDVADADLTYIKVIDNSWDVQNTIFSVGASGAIATDSGITAGGTIEGATLTDGTASIASGAVTAITSLTFTGADADPDAAGEIQYDSTIAVMSGGGLRWFDDDSVRLIVDLETDPSDDDYVVAYDAAADGFYMSAAGTGDMTKAVYDSGDSGGVDVLTTVDSTYASDYVLLIGAAVGTNPPKTDGALTYDATSGTLAATEFSGGGSGLTLASTDLSDTAALLYETELDDLSELTAQIGDVSTFITDDIMPDAGTDPDVDAAGELSVDTDGANEPNDVVLRSIDGGNTPLQIALAQQQKSFQATIIKPNDLADATRDLCPIWSNETGMTFVITKIEAWSDTDDTTVNVEVYDSIFGNNATVDALEIAGDGTANYYVTETTITAPNIAANYIIALDFDDTDDPGWVKLSICGYFLADVD